MRTRVHLYLNDKAETQITSMYDIGSDPFKVGDIFWFEAENLYPKDLKKIETQWGEDVMLNIYAKNKLSHEMFHNKFLKIIRKIIIIKDANDPELVVEYHCKYHTTLYWRWNWVRRIYNVFN